MYIYICIHKKYREREREQERERERKKTNKYVFWEGGVTVNDQTLQHARPWTL